MTMMEKMNLPLVFKAVIGVCAVLQLGLGISCVIIRIIISKNFGEIEEAINKLLQMFSGGATAAATLADMLEMFDYSMLDATFFPFFSAAVLVGFALFPIFPLGFVAMIFSVCEMSVLPYYIKAKKFQIYMCDTIATQFAIGSLKENGQALVDTAPAIMPIAIVGLIICAITILVVQFVIYKFHSGSGGGGTTGTRTF